MGWAACSHSVPHPRRLQWDGTDAGMPCRKRLTKLVLVSHQWLPLTWSSGWLWRVSELLEKEMLECSGWWQ